MNSLLIKALLITGGTVGVGVPGMYYAYPHISNLINPEDEEIKESSEKTTEVKVKNGDSTKEVSSNEGKGETQKEPNSNPPSSSES